MLALSLPIQFSYFYGWFALALFAALAVPIVLLGRSSMAGLGPVRKWTSIGLRLLLLLLLVLILGGIQWTRRATDVHVVVLRDISESTNQVQNYPGPSLDDSVNDYLKAASKNNADTDKKPGDRIGVISFSDRAYVDSVADPDLRLDARAVRERGTGTDVAAAIQLGLATLQRDTLQRLVLLWDGNATTGDLEAALNAASAAHVPIDVMPLKYDVRNEVMVDRFIAPTRKRENEPFTLEIYLTSTNAGDTTGRLTVTHQGLPMDMDPAQAGLQGSRQVTLRPGQNVERIQVPPLVEAGVHQFRSVFEADDPAQQAGTTVGGGGGGGKSGRIKSDTLTANNAASAFTFVSGRGKVLYIDNTQAGKGEVLRSALVTEGIEFDDTRTRVDQFPTSAVELQNYDAVILANVPRGPGGITDEQGRALAGYVHDLGGGLVVIGGPDALGAGGWQGTRLEEILPVDMDVPAKRAIPKGALVLVMHSCEMPDGNGWGIQCGIKAAEVLNSRDEIGVVSFGGGGSVWDYPLTPKDDGSKIFAALKNMALGDMPSFDESVRLALQGGRGSKGLVDSDARNKHMIIISDGDPQAPANDLIQLANDKKITISTVSVYPHDLSAQGLPPTMRDIAKRTGGRAYGPINGNFSQLPQIFIKEATIVRRSLIQEDGEKGFAVKRAASASDVLAGLGDTLPATTAGYVLSTKKANPLVEVPLVVGKENDPLLALWQTGLGKSLVFTSDAQPVWATQWVASSVFSKFWAQNIRAVARPAESADFETRVTNSGGRGKIIVEAVNKENEFRNGLAIRGSVLGPDNEPREVRLVQTAPGTYEGEFDAAEAGNYVVGLSYTGPDSQSGTLRSGTVVNSSPELRELKSNEAVLRQIADRTGGRVLSSFDAQTAALFDRQGLIRRDAPMPVWDLLLPFAIALLLLDVAARRIAWDADTFRRGYAGALNYVRSFTTPRKVETTGSLDALRSVREKTAAITAPGKSAPPASGAPGAPPAVPDRSRKFEATGPVAGDITKVVGGATGESKIRRQPEDKPKPAAPGEPTTNSLLEAKRRAQQKIREKEEGRD